MKAWRTIAKPHQEVLQGHFQQAEFAADISQVIQGTAPPEYSDAQQFFARTYITEGLRLLLISVAQRLAGQGGDPVIQLQTAFGGGKTHALLAVYHLVTTAKEALSDIPELLQAAGIDQLPQARIAVIDGIKLSPSQARHYGDYTIHTLWGELAWQLLGAEGFEQLAASDQAGTSPGKAILIELIQQASPCVILIDELVAFMRQLELGQQYAAGTFDSNISFIQALTEAMKAVPNAVLLASLPESEVEAGGSMGQKALAALEKYFARIESVWKPVASEESFEIVRRRLFEHPGEAAEIAAVCRQFTDFYRQHTDQFPTETQSNDYFERLCRSYPIHPEIFDRLYEDWSTLEKFQRTRGVLQYMAMVIHQLWKVNDSDALILPGSLPLYDSQVRTKSIHYLPQGWEAVIEREVDGPYSMPFEIDQHNGRFDMVQAARRLARSIFLGSAPAAANQAVRGIRTERILLGAVQPNQSIAIFRDALKRLRDHLHYLYTEQERYWFDTRPNLRREMEGRQQNIEQEAVQTLLKQRLGRLLRPPHHFGGIHIFSTSADIPDDYGKGPRLVVLSPETAWVRTAFNPAQEAAENILFHRGEKPRQKQNRLLFLAADYDVVNRLREQARIYLAWDSIIQDIENGILNHDLSHLQQAKHSRDHAEQSLHHLIRDAWKWLLSPFQEWSQGQMQLQWEAVQISATAPRLLSAIEDKLREEEWWIDQWAPIHLQQLLEQWYFKAGKTEINALQVWQDSCHYLYLPRLINDQVFRQTIAQGVASTDYFGFAAGKKDGQYIGFVFGQNKTIILDEQAVLIARETALDWQRHHQKPVIVQKPAEQKKSSAPTPSSKKQFYGAVSLDPIKAKMDFATIIDEVIQHFSTRTDVQINISINIQARSDQGFDQKLEQIILQNCQVLKFKRAEFADE